MLRWSINVSFLSTHALLEMYVQGILSSHFHSDPILLQGVFINPAFIEPFGLTLLEVLISYFSFIFHRSIVIQKKKKYKFYSYLLTPQATAYGLPMVATKNGGPVDIHRVSLLIGCNKLVRRLYI